MDKSFGAQIEGITYRDREGAYAIAFDKQGRVALVEAPVAHGPDYSLFLPGGGIEPGESHQACIRRECLEEIGCAVKVEHYICTGDEYLFAPSDQRYLHMIGQCYQTELLEQVQAPVEQDHTLLWVPVEECARQMFLQYQAWAVQLAWKLRGGQHENQSVEANGL